MFDIDVLLPDLWDILGAVPLTLAMALAIFVFSTIIGSLFAMVEYRRIPVLRQLVVAYKIAFKGVPMVVVIFLAYYGLPSTLQFLTSLIGVDYNGHSTPNWVTLIVALTACVAAFQAEVVRSALNSFDTGGPMQPTRSATRRASSSAGSCFHRSSSPRYRILPIPSWSS